MLYVDKSDIAGSGRGSFQEGRAVDVKVKVKMEVKVKMNENVNGAQKECC